MVLCHDLGNLKSASGIHVRRHDRHTGHAPPRVAEVDRALKLDLRAGLQGRSLGADQHVLEVELDVHLDAHGWPQQRGSRVLRVCYYGVCVCVDSTLPEGPLRRDFVDMCKFTQCNLKPDTGWVHIVHKRIKYKCAGFWKELQSFLIPFCPPLVLLLNDLKK